MTKVRKWHYFGAQRERPAFMRATCACLVASAEYWHVRISEERSGR